MFQTEQNYVLFRFKSMISKTFPNHCVSFKTPCSSPPCKHDSFSFIPLFHVGQEENVTMKSRDFRKFSPPPFIVNKLEKVSLPLRNRGYNTRKRQRLSAELSAVSEYKFVHEDSKWAELQVIFHRQTIRSLVRSTWTRDKKKWKIA